MSGPAEGERDFGRGVQLLILHRYGEAAAAFRSVLSVEPGHAWALHHLAFALWKQDESAAALEVAERAASAEPEEARHQVLRARVLNDLERTEEAERAAEAAIRMEPELAAAHTALCEVLVAKSRWPAAEAAARRALAIDPEDAAAAHLLAWTLRRQGRREEDHAVVSRLLERDPESPAAHANAGWAALDRRDHRAAEVHFREALRLDPGSEAARQGLLESFRARSPAYRLHLAYTQWMARQEAWQRWAIVIGLLVGIRLARAVFTGDLAFVGILIAFLYLCFALWSWVATGVGNLIILADRWARLVLRRSEVLEGVLVGGGLFAGLALIVAGVALHSTLAMAGAYLAAGTIPMACTLGNDRVVGRVLFGVIAVAAWAVAAGWMVVSAWGPAAEGRFAEVVAGASGPVLLACVLTTWAGMVPYLRRRT